MCECNNDIKVIETPQEISEAFEVRGRGNIISTPTKEGNKTVFIVEYKPYVAPSISATSNPVREVGQTVSFSWNVNIQPGREAITNREISPLPDPVPNLEAPFTVTVTNKKRTSRGSQTYFTITVEDAANEEVARALAITFVNKVFMGFSYKDGVSAGQVLTEADIAAFTGTLADNIKSVYNGTVGYNIPPAGVLQYIYWLYEVGTTPINAMELSGLPFPIVFIPGSIEITNPHDGSIKTNYAIVRSANKFGTGSLSLRML